MKLLRRPVAVAVTAASILLATGCSSSPKPPDTSRVVVRLSSDVSLKPAVALVPAGQAGEVWSCVARRLVSDAKAPDLQRYVDGKGSFTQVSGRHKGHGPSQDVQDCVRQTLNAH